MNGRTPVHRLEVLQEGNNPVDLSISNPGEADEECNVVVIVSWNGGALVAGDALPGWTVRTERERAVFRSLRSRLPPGSRRSIGWLRYDHIPAGVQSFLSRN